MREAVATSESAAPKAPTPTSDIQSTFGQPFRARTTIGAQLPVGAEIEIDAIAVLDR